MRFNNSYWCHMSFLPPLFLLLFTLLLPATARAEKIIPVKHILAQPIFLTVNADLGNQNNTLPHSTPPAAHYDFGEAPAFNAVHIEHTFTLENNTEKIVSIDRLKTPCVCTQARVEGFSDPSLVTVAPGRSIFVTVSVDLTHFPSGVLNKAVEVLIKGQRMPGAVLNITGIIRPMITFTPRQLNFGTIAAGQEVSATVEVSINAIPSSSLNRFRLVSSNPELHVTSENRPSTQQPDSIHASDFVSEKSGSAPVMRSRGDARQVTQKYKIVLAADAPLGLLAGKLFLITDTSRSGRLDTVVVPITGNITGDITTATKLIGFGRLTSGTAKTQTVTLIGPDTAALEGLHVSSDSSFLSAQVEKTPPINADSMSEHIPATTNSEGKRLVISVTLSPSTPPGMFHATVTIVTRKNERLLLPAFAAIMNP